MTGRIKFIIIYYFNYKNTIMEQYYKTYNTSKVHIRQNLNMNTRKFLNDC